MHYVLALQNSYKEILCDVFPQVRLKGPGKKEYLI